MTSVERRVAAERVKLLRVAAGLTQSDLAEAAGVSRPTIIDMERGAKVPQQEKLVRILAVLGVDVAGSSPFSEQTDLWLSIMGALIEAIPDGRREPAVNAAIRELSAGVQGASVGTTDDDYEFTAQPPIAADVALAAKKGKRKIDQGPSEDEEQGE